MKLGKQGAPGYLRNCYLAHRKDDPPFLDDSSGKLVIRLDGYAVVPLEEYNSHIGNVAGLADEQGRGAIAAAAREGENAEGG